VQKAIDKYNAESKAQLAQAIAYLQKYKAGLAHIKAFAEKLGQLQSNFNACKEALKTHDGSMTLEKLHDTCGSMFDGNIVQEAYTRYPVPDRTFEPWTGPGFCSDDGTVCLNPDDFPADLIN
jgi:hypothetical protein